MMRFRGSLPLLSAGALVLAGCQDDVLSPTEPQAPPALEPAFQTAPLAESLPRPHEAHFHKISQEIKGFGGYFFDPEGNLVAYLVDSSEEGRARELLEPVLRDHVYSARQRVAGSLRFLRGEYSFLELAAWRERAMEHVLEIRGVEYSDLDEARNRLVVGVSSSSARDESAKVLREHAVPLEAVVFEATRPAVRDITLRDRSRPIEGGFQIARKIDEVTQGLCTLGFNAYWSGYRGFVTNSHCTPTYWGKDWVSIYQNSVASSNLVGYELHDPGAKSCGIFGIFQCRWSDAAFILTYSSVLSNHGSIARTTFWATGLGNSGSITVDPNNPRMKITGEYLFPASGEMVDKMGRTTGWTYGWVKKTCVDVNSGLQRVRCQYLSEKMHTNGGDSGSPVFRWHGSTVTLAGIHWGRITLDGVNFAIMSPMWNIEADLGALSTF